MEDYRIVDAALVEVTFPAGGFKDELWIFVRRAEGSRLVLRGKDEMRQGGRGCGDGGIAEKLATRILHNLPSSITTAIPCVGRSIEAKSLFVRTSCIRPAKQHVLTIFRG